MVSILQIRKPRSYVLEQVKILDPDFQVSVMVSVGSGSFSIRENQLKKHALTRLLLSHLLLKARKVIKDAREKLQMSKILHNSDIQNY